MASPGKSKRFAGQMPIPRGEAGACSSRGFQISPASDWPDFCLSLVPTLSPFA